MVHGWASPTVDTVVQSVTGLCPQIGWSTHGRLRIGRSTTRLELDKRPIVQVSAGEQGHDV